MSNKHVATTWRRIPNANVEGKIHFRLDHLPSNASTAHVDLPLIPLQITRDEICTPYNFPLAQSLPWVPPGVAAKDDVSKPAKRHRAWYATPRGIASILGLLLSVTVVVALSAFLAMQDSPPSSPPQSPFYSPPPRGTPAVISANPSPPLSPSSLPVVFVTNEKVTFDLEGVPLVHTLVSIEDVLKAAIVDVLPHFVKDEDVTLKRNATIPTTVHVEVDCGVQSNSAPIVPNVVLEPSFVSILQSESGFTGLAVDNVQIKEIEIVARPLPSPPPPPSPLLPGGMPSMPPHPPDAPASDYVQCFDYFENVQWIGSVLAVESGTKNRVLDKCALQSSCSVASKHSSVDPWLLSTRQGYPANESGAVTFVYRDDCVAGNAAEDVSSSRPRLDRFGG